MVRKILIIITYLAVANCAAIDKSSLNANHLVPKNPAPIHEDQAEKSRTPLFNDKYTQIANNGAYITHTYPVYSTPIHTYPQYSISPVNAYTPPIYHHGVPVLTKTYSTPVLTKGPEVSYSPQLVQDHSIKALTYSQAPLVSHMTFTGLGTNYAW
ncbi:unnamed protein product [Pieris brassicae]|uniref:Cuticle protein n=1 Tax=Pieris brassicae TaxID=7116 RepID=A0A9P0TTA9_PIEBR|nr:unnamed protein product [Pieris brassicae]